MTSPQHRSAQSRKVWKNQSTVYEERLAKNNENALLLSQTVISDETQKTHVKLESKQQPKWRYPTSLNHVFP